MTEVPHDPRQLPVSLSGQTAEPQDGTGGEAALPLGDDELQACVDAMKAVYVERPENRRAERLFRKLHRATMGARRQHIPLGTLPEGRVLMIYGRPRSGKTALIQRMLAGQPGLAATEGAECPLVDFQVKAPASLPSVGTQILQRLGYPLRGKLDRFEAWRLAYEHLRLRKTVVIHLGEMQNVTKPVNAADREVLRDIVRSLVIDEQNPMLVILSGKPNVYEFLMEDEQIEERASTVSLEPMRPGQAPVLAEGIRGVARSVDLDVDEDELLTEIVPRLMHVARYALGRAMEIAVEAAQVALAPEDEDGVRLPPEPVLTRRHFATYYEQRTGNSDFANPFLARQWDALDPRRKGVVLPSQLEDEEDDDEAPANGGRRR